MSHQYDALDENPNTLTRPNHKNSWRVTPSREMIPQMTKHRMPVLRDEDPPFALRPQENLRILAGERQIGWSADADHIELSAAP